MIWKKFSAFLLPLAFLAAQSTPEPARGRVLDPTRAPIAGARITAVPWGGASGAVAATAVSDQKGEFSLPLDAGNYILKVSAEGFLETSQTVRGPGAIEFILEVARKHETVTVTESAGYQIEATSSGTKTL